MIFKNCSTTSWLQSLDKIISLQITNKYVFNSYKALLFMSHKKSYWNWVYFLDF